MSALFLTLVNRSLAAGWLILAIILLRPFLRRVSRSICCALWGLVAFRLLCPFSIESVLSLIPNASPIPTDLTALPPSAANGGASAGTQVGGELLSPFPSAPPAGSPATVSPAQTVLQIVAVLWVSGVVLFALYAALSYLRLRVRVQVSAQQDGYWVCERIRTPFVFGLIRPRIYLPLSMDGRDIPYVLAHERAHIARRDHWRKVFAFALLSVFWFHPLMWVAFLLLCRDIEFACDERVLSALGADARSKKDYAEALVRGSFPQLPVLTCPLAFGGLQVKQRVLSVARYRKPAISLVLAALLICSTVAVCFLTDPKVGADAPVHEQEPPAQEGSNETTPQPDKNAFSAIKEEKPAELPAMIRGSKLERLYNRMKSGEVNTWYLSDVIHFANNEGTDPEFILNWAIQESEKNGWELIHDIEIRLPTEEDRRVNNQMCYCLSYFSWEFLENGNYGHFGTGIEYTNRGTEDGSITIYLLYYASKAFDSEEIGSEILTIPLPAGETVTVTIDHPFHLSAIIGTSYGDISVKIPVRAWEEGHPYRVWQGS